MPTPLLNLTMLINEPTMKHPTDGGNFHSIFFCDIVDSSYGVGGSAPPHFPGETKRTRLPRCWRRLQPTVGRTLKTRLTWCTVGYVAGVSKYRLRSAAA